MKIKIITIVSCLLLGISNSFDAQTPQRVQISSAHPATPLVSSDGAGEYSVTKAMIGNER